MDAGEALAKSRQFLLGQTLAEGEVEAGEEADGVAHDGLDLGLGGRQAIQFF